MTKKIAFCNIQYTYESYVGIDVEKPAWKIHDYILREFAEFHPLVSEPGNGVEMPDYVDVTLKKNDGFFIEADKLSLQAPISFIQLGAKGENKTNETFENPEDDYQTCRKRER